jgi:hypothetical protein
VVEVAACLAGAKETAEATRDAMITDFILETLFDDIVNERNKKQEFQVGCKNTLDLFRSSTLNLQFVLHHFIDKKCYVIEIDSIDYLDVTSFTVFRVDQQKLKSFDSLTDRAGYVRNCRQLTFGRLG